MQTIQDTLNKDNTVTRIITDSITTTKVTTKVMTSQQYKDDLVNRKIEVAEAQKVFSNATAIASKLK